MRQKDDLQYAELLNRLREGLHTEEDIATLMSRHVKHNEEQAFHGLPHLFCTRKDVASHNLMVLNETCSEQKVNIEAIDDISGDISPSLRDVLLNKIPTDASLTMGLQKNLELGLDLPAEMSLNIDTEDGLTNGAACIIKKFDFRVSGSSRCSIVWVQFEENSIGKRWRNKYCHLYNQGIDHCWTPILETCRKFTFKYYKTYLIARRQFPLYLAAGKTVHKSQGSTITEAVMHFGSRKIDHIHYVGLSRVTRLAGVHIMDLNSSKISVSYDVETEMNRLRDERNIDCIPQDLGALGTDLFKVCFQNCRSLQKHFEDLKHEGNLLSADILGLVETRVCEFDKYSIDGFTMVSSSLDLVPHGIVIYVKSSLNVHKLDAGTVCGIEYLLIDVHQAFLIGFVYCPPKTATLSNLTYFLSVLSTKVSEYDSEGHKKLLLMGDFNFDWHINTSLEVFLQMLMLKQIKTAVTTDYSSCIDHIYSNMSCEKIVKSGTLKSYYSDHKPLFVALSL